MNNFNDVIDYIYENYQDKCSINLDIAKQYDIVNRAETEFVKNLSTASQTQYTKLKEELSTLQTLLYKDLIKYLLRING